MWIESLRDYVVGEAVNVSDISLIYFHDLYIIIVISLSAFVCLRRHLDPCWAHKLSTTPPVTFKTTARIANEISR